MSWGSNWSVLWGGGSTGAAPPVGGFFVVAAIASSSTTFQVAMSENPLFASPLRSGDASNLANWSLIRMDTGERVPLLFVRGLQGVPDVLEFGIFGRFVSPLVQYRVTAGLQLLSDTGDPIIEPRNALFAGSPEALRGAQTRELVDIRNPQVQKDQFNGGLVVRSNGDYDLESGVTLVKKLIIRRLTTLKDEFFHLSGRDYGAGVENKAFFTTADIVALQADAERQVRREPEVGDVSVGVSLTADSRLTINVKARLKRTGESFSVTTTIPST